MRCLIACLAAVFAGSVVATAAPVPKDKSVIEELIGTWRIVLVTGEDPADGWANVEFTRDGKMIFTFENGGDNKKLAGTYKPVGKDKFEYKLTLPDGKDKSEVLTIKKLTGDNLVTADQADRKEYFKRIKFKKK